MGLPDCGVAPGVMLAKSLSSTGCDIKPFAAESAVLVVLLSSGRLHNQACSWSELHQLAA